MKNRKLFNNIICLLNLIILHGVEFKTYLIGFKITAMQLNYIDTLNIAIEIHLDMHKMN